MKAIDDDDGSDRRAGRRGEAEVTLPEDVGPILEQELEQRLEHGNGGILSL